MCREMELERRRKRWIVAGRNQVKLKKRQFVEYMIEKTVWGLPNLTFRRSFLLSISLYIPALSMG